jgi:hypothetical protein
VIIIGSPKDAKPPPTNSIICSVIGPGPHSDDAH